MSSNMPSPRRTALLRETLVDLSSTVARFVILRALLAVERNCAQTRNSQ